MLAHLPLIIFLSNVVLGAACDYDSVAAFRDKDVMANFDPAKMEGLWYEHGYADPAQTGASCQTLNGSYDASTGTLNTDFSVLYYGSLPFTIKEHYVPHDSANSAMSAVYRKSVTAPFNIPGGSLLGLPTAVVSATLSADKSRYDAVIIYSCLALVNELVIATRSPSLSDSDYQLMVSDLKSRSIPAVDSLKQVDWSKCKTSESAVVV